MLVADSNVILRLLLQDDLEQEGRIRNYLRRLEKQGQQVFLPQLVVQECLWVLNAVKGIPREDVSEMLLALIDMDVFMVEETTRLRQALRIYAEHSINFVDAYVAGVSRELAFSGVLSFDKDMAKLGVHWVRP